MSPEARTWLLAAALATAGLITLTAAAIAVHYERRRENQS